MLSFYTRISVREVVLMYRKSPIMTLFCFGWFPIRPSLALQPTPIYLLEYRRRSKVCIYNDLLDSFQLFPFGAAQCAINIWSVNILALGYFALVRFFDILIINNLNGNFISFHQWNERTTLQNWYLNYRRIPWVHIGYSFIFNEYLYSRMAWRCIFLYVPIH